ncbi:hypothetical protein GGX14DRAFT_569951 [Mycena pura]|uniref:Uncharacterized protein n=1 Tax=Mycena pura TaxID=153505 RepID=A0AAD6Y9A1_9AGAR|nr:hypothetical protein GGX14DRAFT_569951 [Mycena pura]
MCTITIAEHRRRPRRTLRTLHIRLSKTFGAFGAPRPSAKLARTLFLTPQNTVNAPLLAQVLPRPTDSDADACATSSEHVQAPHPFPPSRLRRSIVQARARCVNAPAYEELRRALGATLYNPTIARRELGAAAAHAARHAIARVRCLGGCSMRYSPHAFYAADPASRAQIRRGTLGVLTDACSSPRAAWTVRCAARSRLACPRCGGRRAVARARGPEHGRGISGRSEFEHGAGLQVSFYAKGTSPGAYPLGPPLLAKIIRLGADGAFPCPKLHERSMRHSLHTRCRRHPPQMLARRSRSTPTASLERALVRRALGVTLWNPTITQRAARDHRTAGTGGRCSRLPRLRAAEIAATIAQRELGAAASCRDYRSGCSRSSSTSRDCACATHLDRHCTFRATALRRRRGTTRQIYTPGVQHPLLAGGSSDRGGEGRRDDATDEQRASTKLRVATRMCRCLPGLRNLAGPLCTARQVQRVAFGVEHPTAESSFGRVVALHQIEDEECLLDLEDADSLLDRVQDLVSQCMNDFPDDKINDDASKYAADMTKASITEGTRAGHSRQVV